MLQNLPLVDENVTLEGNFYLHKVWDTLILVPDCLANFELLITQYSLVHLP